MHSLDAMTVVGKKTKKADWSLGLIVGCLFFFYFAEQAPEWSIVSRIIPTNKALLVFTFSEIIKVIISLRIMTGL